jgi:hypothetical protein
VFVGAEVLRGVTSTFASCKEFTGGGEIALTSGEPGGGVIDGPSPVPGFFCYVFSLSCAEGQGLLFREKETNEGFSTGSLGSAVIVRHVESDAARVSSRASSFDRLGWRRIKPVVMVQRQRYK